MVTMGVFPFQGKTHMVEPGIEPGTSWLVVRNSDHQATRLVTKIYYKMVINSEYEMIYLNAFEVMDQNL